MAGNQADSVLKIVAQVEGAQSIKGLSDSLKGLNSVGQLSSDEFGRMQAALDGTANKIGRNTAGLKAHAAALRQLQAHAKIGGAEYNRFGQEISKLEGRLGQLNGSGAIALDGLSKSAARGLAGIRQLQQHVPLAGEQITSLRNEVLQYGAANDYSKRSIELQVAALKNLRDQAAINGSAYKALGEDIQRIEAVTKSTSAAVVDAANNQKKASASWKEAANVYAANIEAQTKFVASLKSTDGHLDLHLGTLRRLQGEAAQLGVAWEPGIRGLKLLAQASAANMEQQRGHISQLQKLQAVAGEGYRGVGREIDALRQKAASLDLSKGLQVTPGNVARGTVGAVQSIVSMRQDLARSMMGRVVLTGEGLAASGVAGAAGMGVASGLGGMAGGVQGLASSLDAIAAKAAAMPGVLKPLGGLLSEPAAAAANSVGQWSASLTAAQAKLAALAGPFEAIGNAISAIGPEASAAAGVASLAIAGVYQVLSRQADAAEADLEASFRGISDGAQKVLSDLVRVLDRVPNARLEAQQRLAEINSARLGEFPSDSLEARRAANAVVSAEREISKIKEQQKALIESAQHAQNRSGDALRAQIQVARERLQTQQQLTAETRKTADADRSARQVAGSIRRNQERVARQAELERPQREADAQARALLQSQKTVAQQRLEQQRALTAEQQRTNEVLRQEAAIRGSIRRNQERVAQEQARATRRDADLAARASAAFPPSRVLALPAAGQSSFQGAIDNRGFGGGARAAIAAGGGERPLIMGGDRPGRAAFGGASDYAGPQFGVASNATVRASQRTRGALAELFITIDRVTAASNGSVASLQRQRSAWEALRTAVNPAAPAYARATAQVKQLDEQLGKLTITQQKQQKQQGRGIGREAIGSAMGTLAVGGGVQGAVGALAGGLAFSGGPAGMIAGAGVAAIASTLGAAIPNTMELQQAQLKLKLLSEGFDSYNAVQRVAIDLGNKFNITQADASEEFASAYARLRPLGFTLGEISDVYQGFNTAAKLSGTTAQEAAGSWLQLNQALGSGVLRGEELNSVYKAAPSVIREVAKVMDIPIGKIKEYAEQGKISSAIVLEALQNISTNGAGKLAASMDGPIEKTNALKKAWNELSVEVGAFVMPALTGVLDITTKIIKGLKDVDWSVLAMGLGADPYDNSGYKPPRIIKPKLQPYTVAGITYGPITGASISRDLSGERSRAAAARQATAVGSGASKAGSAAGQQQGFQPSSRARALISAAGKLGVSPLDMATIISFETGGTFDPGKRGGSGNNYLGLIQMGGPERKQYGAHAGQSFEEQVQGPVVRYFQDRFQSRGMSTQGADLLTLYRTVLGGNPKASLTRKDGNGVTPASGVARMGPHRQKALQMFFGGSMENVGYDPAQAGADRVQGAEEAAALQKTRADQLAAARELLATNQGLLRIAEATGPAAKALAEFEAERAEQARRYTELLKGVNGNPDAQAALNAAQAAEAGRAELAYREDLKRITAEQLDLDRQRLDKLAELNNEYREIATRDSASAGFKQGMQEYYDSIGNLRDGISDLAVTGFKGLEDAAMSLATTGSTTFKAFASSILADASRMILRTLVLKTIMEAIGAITKSSISVSSAQGDSSSWGDFTPPASADYAAKGATFANGIAKFARGGVFTNSVVNRATLFKFASGGSFRTGVMGEAAPEAIMPLMRDGQGRLGVSAKGGATGSTQVNIAVHVHPNGDVSSNSDGSGDARALGDNLARMLVPMVAPMVDRQLQLHMERGGLLNK